MPLLYQIVTLFWIHWIADFILQTDMMAMNKSTSLKWLASHVGVYTIPLFLFGWKFSLVNGALHFCVDFCTSRWTSYLWKKGDRHHFFVVIGLDQAIHMTCLVMTLVYFR